MGKTPKGGNDVKAQEFVRQIYKQTKVLDSGARGATTTFAERGIGDVLLVWEMKHSSSNVNNQVSLRIVTPSFNFG